MPELSPEAIEIAERVESFVRETIASFETDPRRDSHGPSDELASELRELARSAGLLTPHIKEDGSHFSHLETALSRVIISATGAPASGSYRSFSIQNRISVSIFF